MSGLTDKLKDKGPIEKPLRKEPLWQGPEAKGPLGGVTFSMLSNFFVCRERFRLKYVLGMRPKEEFKPAIEYGNMWHVCEEHFAASGNSIVNNPVVDPPWLKALHVYAKELCKKYRYQQPQVEHWYNLCKVQFPLYVEHWKKHPDVKNRTPLMQEQVFDIPYKLPSGRIVRLRGKFDSVDLIKEEKIQGIYIQENKTKSAIDAIKLRRQLSFDLQTMIYTIAADWFTGPVGGGTLEKGVAKQFCDHPIRGVRYNVIRRSAHKSVESFQKKITEDIGDGRANEWFGRWKVEISPADVKKFHRECLDPVLEQLCDWYNCVTNWNDPFDYAEPHSNNVMGRSIHWRHPFGVYNVLDEGGSSDVDEFLATGSMVGMTQTDKLFTELQE